MKDDRTWDQYDLKELTDAVAREALTAFVEEGGKGLRRIIWEGLYSAIRKGENEVLNRLAEEKRK